MPVVQSGGAYSVGRDISVVLTHPLAPSGRVDISNVTKFTSTPKYTSVQSKRIDGRRLSAQLPDGWSCEIDLDRNGPILDNLMFLVEQAWRTGGALYQAQVFAYITEPDGSTSAFHYQDCSLAFGNMGDWAADSIVTQKITCEADTRVPV